jgi:hypothetical protein
MSPSRWRTPLSAFSSLPSSENGSDPWLSRAFASDAQGAVTYLQGRYIGNTWQYVEKPIVEMQGNPITTVLMQ